ncbi:hypothetical protein ISS85_01905 [Candidatus Microgenomates bacterium]|nr:hypothetical protein [Candidatus Microgenomates bacterium]
MNKERKTGLIEKTAKVVEYSGIVIAVLGLIGGLTQLAVGGAVVGVGADMIRRHQTKKRQ